MFIWEAVESQAGLPIPLETSDRRWIDGGILLHEPVCNLISLLAIILIENGFEFQSNLVLLLLGNISQDVLHFVFDAALAGAFWGLFLVLRFAMVAGIAYLALVGDLAGVGLADRAAEFERAAAHHGAARECELGPR